MNHRVPDVFEFRDYRLFLKAYYEAGRKSGTAVSLRAFGKRAGLRSPNYFKLVMDGQRNLTSDMAARFAEAAGLRGDAANYFCELVAFNQEKNAAARKRAHERLARYARYRKVHKLAVAQEAYYSHWYLPAIRELAARRDFQDDPKWIARTLTPPISVREAERALRTLTELGLLIRDEEGRLVQADGLVEMVDGPLGHQVVAFHRSMMERASDALERVPREEREIGSLTLCLSEAQMRELKALLARFREEVMQQFPAGEDAKRVVQVNVHMFPLSVKED